MERALAVVFVNFIHPKPAPQQRVQGAQTLHLAIGLHLVDEQGSTHARYITRQQITLRPRSAHLDHLTRGQQGGQETRDRGLTHTQARLQLGAAGVAVVAFQNGDEGIGMGH